MTPFDDVGDLRAEQLRDALGRGQRVLDDVVEQPGGDRHDVELHVGEEVGDLERMHQVRLARVADLPLMFQRRKDVRPPEKLEVGFRAVAPHFFEQRLESNHLGPALANSPGMVSNLMIEVGLRRVKEEPPYA